ncbi:hypothetical protein GCM10025786_31130 [Nocardioides caeni]
MIVEKACPRCGRPFFVSDRPKAGRPRRWCSGTCRRLASEERRAAQAGHPVITSVTEPVSLEQHVRAVLDSPSACRRILREIHDRSARGELVNAKWSSVADELARLRQPPRGNRWIR